MSDSNSKAIVFLLTAILCVMLFGANQVLNSIGWIFGIGLSLGILYLIFSGGFKLIRGFLGMVIEAKKNKQPWVWIAFVIPALIGVFAITFFAAIVWWNNDVNFTSAMDQILYSKVPLVLLLVGVGILAVENASQWLPKAPN